VIFPSGDDQLNTTTQTNNTTAQTNNVTSTDNVTNTNVRRKRASEPTDPHAIVDWRDHGAVTEVKDQVSLHSLMDGSSNPIAFGLLVIGGLGRGNSLAQTRTY
jgi:hypothetical protein